MMYLPIVKIQYLSDKCVFWPVVTVKGIVYESTALQTEIIFGERQKPKEREGPASGMDLD